MSDRDRLTIGLRVTVGFFLFVGILLLLCRWMLSTQGAIEISEGFWW